MGLLWAYEARSIFNQIPLKEREVKPLALKKLKYGSTPPNVATYNLKIKYNDKIKINNNKSEDKTTTNAISQPINI